MEREYTRQRQLTPTLWGEYIVRTDGSETLIEINTLAELLDLSLPLVLSKEPMVVGCHCGGLTCPIPLRQLPTERDAFIREFAKYRDSSWARDVHLDAGGRAACGFVNLNDAWEHELRDVHVLPEYWDEWEGQQCAACAELVQSGV